MNPTLATILKNLIILTTIGYFVWLLFLGGNATIGAMQNGEMIRSVLAGLLSGMSATIIYGEISTRRKQRKSK